MGIINFSATVVLGTNFISKNKELAINNLVSFDMEEFDSIHFDKRTWGQHELLADTLCLYLLETSHHNWFSRKWNILTF